ncbi:MAG: hypothetical protein GX610_13800 [Rhodococcus sp.]|nr:hypothetical protein [Rhodococcus sp. (in: high G+C Gram-positive bacteria)]
MTQPDGGYPQQPVPPTPPKKKSKKWPWIVGGIVGVIAIASIASNGSTGDESTTADAPAPAAEQGQAPAPQPEAEQPVIPPLAPAPSAGDGKSIQYEVISDSGSLNSVTWFDENSAIQQKQNVSAPWSLTVENPSTFVIAGVGAQTDGTSVTCRVIVDGEVEDEQTATGQYAVVNCNAGF